MKNKMRFKGLSKQYEGRSTYAVKDFNLDIKEGELVVIVGPSGSGKSTLLELICGFETPSEGTIEIEGVSIVDKLPKDRDVAMVFQNYALLPHLSVYDNIAFGMKIRKMNKLDIKEKVEWAAALVQLTPYLKVKPKKLSGGQRQRVAVARAMVREPKLFLMDEPLSHLDTKLRETMMHEIQSLQKQLGITMLYVTHDQIEAMTLADRMVIMNEGMIQQVGTPYTIYHHPRNLFVAEFIGRPRINLFTCKATKLGILVEDFIIPYKGGDLELDKTYSLGIRSEHIQSVTEGAHVEARIQKIEYLGSETLLYLRYKEHTITLKDYTSQSFEINQLLKLKFDLDHIHFFDTQTKKNIRSD